MNAMLSIAPTDQPARGNRWLRSAGDGQLQRATWIQLVLTAICLTTGTLLPMANAQEFFERYDDWPEQTTIRGSLVLAPSTDCLETLAAGVRELVDGRSITVINMQETEVPDAVLRAAGLLSEQVTTLDLQVSDSADAISSTTDCLLVFSDAFVAEDAVAAREQYIVQLQGHLRRSGLLIVVGEGAARLGLLPDCLVEFAASGTSDAAGEDTADQSLEGDKLSPQRVGIQLTADSLLVLSGRLLQVLGPGYVGLSLAGTERQAPQTQVLRARERRRPTNEWLADLTQWRRRAMELGLEPFPPEERQIPEVPHGTLLIVGGGGVPDGLMERFIDRAGGVEEARLVYIPCSEEERVSEGGILRQWRAMGVKHVAQIHTKDRSRANGDEEFLEPLRTATGLWFGGGRQWNFADSYYGTQAHRLMKEVLQRGGVVGGSSAGASIQGSYLARATPIGNMDIMAPGYERGGLGFICGVAIDQHFSQRDRHADLKQLVTQYPQLLGIGIDETTAIEVVGSQATVLGKGRVFFDQWIAGDAGGEVVVAELSAGEVYDLAERSIVESAAR